MATATQPAARPKPHAEPNHAVLPELTRRNFALIELPILERWHLLSLDAPTVAALWAWFLAASNHLRLPVSATVAMAVAVWTLYAGDRLLDSRASTLAPRLPQDLEPRHLFHHQHRRPFRIAILIASLALAALLPNLAPEAIALYLILGALLLAYFLLIHTQNANPGRTAQRLPKELAVGVFFSAATFIPTVARQPELRLKLLPAALLLAALCSLNCLFIYAWEHPHSHGAETPHPATALALRFLHPLTLLTAFAAALLALFKALSIAVAHPALLAHSPFFMPPWPICAAIAIAALLLFTLDHSRRRFTPTSLRAAADLCLLTPLLLLLFLR